MHLKGLTSLKSIYVIHVDTFTSENHESRS